MTTMSAIEQLIEQQAAQATAAEDQRKAEQERRKAACIANSTAAIKHLCGKYWPLLEPWTTFDASNVSGSRDDAAKAVIDPPAEALLAPMTMRVTVSNSAPGYAADTANPALWRGSLYIGDEQFAPEDIERVFYYARQFALVQANRAAYRAAIDTERLAVAANILACVAVHDAAQIAYDQACRTYAEYWTAALWSPVELWLVRYAPIGFTSYPSNDDDGESVIQEIVTLEAPADILSRRPGATVHMVTHGGRVQERAIGAFLDATPIRTDPPSLTDRLDYYPTWRVGKYYAHGRPDEGHSPTGAPPPAPLALHARLAAADLPYAWLNDGYRDIPTTPEVFVERYSTYL